MRDYKQVINGIAYNQLSKVPDIPDDRLAIGGGEKLESIPIYVFSDFHLPQAGAPIPSYEDIKVEESTSKFDGSKLSVDNFPHSDFLGGIPSVGI